MRQSVLTQAYHQGATGKLALPVFLRSLGGALKTSLGAPYRRRAMRLYLGLTAALCTPYLAAEDEARGNLIKNGSFESAGFEGWTRACLGDRRGQVSLVKEAVHGQTAARIESPTERSWTFLRQQGFKVALGERLTLSACAKSSSSSVKLVLTSGYVWVSDPRGHTTRRASHSGSGEWELLRATITVHELPVSAAIGFDYRSEGQTLLVDDVRLEGESDVLCREALALAIRYEELSRRSDVSQTLRQAAAKRAAVGRALTEEYNSMWRAVKHITDNTDGWQEFHSRLRAYVDAGTQLVVRCDQGRDGGGLSVSKIDLKARLGQDAETTLTLLNLFGEHSVAVRVTCDRFTEKAGNESVDVDRVRLMQVISGAAPKKRPAFLPLGEASLVLVPRSDLCRVQCTIDASRLTPGLYKGTLTVLPLDRRQAGARQCIPVRVEVTKP